MALINCPECGKKVSNITSECFYCGYPLLDMVVNKAILPEPENDGTQQDNISLLISEADRLRTTTDYDKAFFLYEKAAQLGDSYAQIWVGNFYSRGLGREKDYHKALSWYEKAAQQNNCDALNNIGTMYENGNGVTQDYSKAIYYYEQAIALGSTIAKNNLGVLYNNLAVRYIDGKGVDIDYERANSLLNTALQLGNEKAKENYAILQNLIQQKRTNELTKKYILVTIGMFLCLIIGFGLFISCIMNGQHTEGLTYLFLFSVLGWVISYSSKSVRENDKAVKETGEYVRLHEGFRCPNCGMHAGHRISDFSKKTSIAFWGIASSKLGKTYECENCKYMW